MDVTNNVVDMSLHMLVIASTDAVKTNKLEA